MKLSKIVGLLIVAFIIEDPIAKALLEDICTKNYIFCLFGKLLLFLFTFLVIYFVCKKLELIK